MTYSTLKIPKNKKPHNARMKRFVSYTVLVSFLWGNVAQAGKEILGIPYEDAPLIRTVNPIRHNSAQEATQLFFHLDDKSIEISGTDGQIRP